MIRMAFLSGTLMVGLTVALPAGADPQGFQGRPNGGDTPGDQLLRLHGMTVQQYDKMREEAEAAPMTKK